MIAFTPTRAAGLTRLEDFLPHAVGNYARRRNFDLPGHANVSRMSPWLRHRVVTEAEVIAAVVARHGPEMAEKFLSEVTWRLYFKGWLERRPSVWAAYKIERQAAWNRMQTESGLRHQWEAACRGETGIACFDHWAQELTQSGYLHNHARMWCASIWIFTLGLPWTLGADFFLRHLLDGDAASNTLSWRWVAGLQTRGKHYLAQADNIATYTDGRFAPTGLAEDASALNGPPHPPLGPCPTTDPIQADLRSGLLLTEDDLHPDPLLANGLAPVATATLQATTGRSILVSSAQAVDFTRAAIADCTTRLTDRLGPITACVDTDEILHWASAHRLEQVVMHNAAVGPARDALEGLRAKLLDHGVRFSVQVRPLDALASQHATAGFYKFRAALPEIIALAQP